LIWISMKIMLESNSVFLPGGCVLRCAVVIGAVEDGLAADAQHEALHAASGEADMVADQMRALPRVLFVVRISGIEARTKAIATVMIAGMNAASLALD
jgi:hypothetical protein